MNLYAEVQGFRWNDSRTAFLSFIVTLLSNSRDCLNTLTYIVVEHYMSQSALKRPFLLPLYIPAPSHQQLIHILQTNHPHTLRTPVVPTNQLHTIYTPRTPAVRTNLLQTNQLPHQPCLPSKSSASSSSTSTSADTYRAKIAPHAPSMSR